MILKKQISHAGLCLLFILFFGTLAPLASGATSDVQTPEKPPMQLFPVRGIDFVYAYPHPDHEAGRHIEKFTIDLIATEWGYGTAEDGFTGAVPVSIDDIEQRGRIYISASALQEIIKAGVKHFTAQGYMGVYILPHPEDVSTYGKDARPPNQSKLRFMVFTSSVQRVQTRTLGPRFLNEELLAEEHHKWIADNSPVHPAKKEGRYDDLLNRKAINDYISRLNRHPGRHVSMTVGGTDAKGKAALEYRVTESKPWITYLQFTDTGTGNTADWQKRAGYIHNQVSGHDDILSLDYTTAGFDDYNAANIKYEAPWMWEQINKLRIGASGSFSEFTSTDVGLPGIDFTGKTYSLGFNLDYLLFQKEDWFLDLTGGLEYKHVQVNNELAQVQGDEKFLKPSIGLVLERQNRTANTKARLTLETNMAGLAGTDSTSLAGLGRTDIDARWVVARGSVAHSFFLEPLIYGNAFRDPSTPESSTMAHEVRLNARAQYVMGTDRLIPQEKFVAGGLYSVRGYPQSVVSGDNGFIGSAEYRLHLPRLLPFNPNPKTKLFGDVFRMTPTQVYGYPDWDLVFKLFTDFGYTANNDKIIGLENNETLWSVGGGIELQIRKNLRLQIDYGHSLLDLESGRVERGDGEVHFEATLFF